VTAQHGFEPEISGFEDSPLNT